MTAGARLTHLEGANIGALSTAQATTALRQLAIVRGKADQLEAAITRRLAELHDAGQAAPVADALGRSVKRSRRAAEQAERRAVVLGATPRVDDALGKGRIGVEHADALAAAAGRLDDSQRGALIARDDQITDHASSSSPESFRRWLNKAVDAITADDGLARAAQQQDAVSASIRRNDDTGMFDLFAKLTPEQGHRMRRKLDAEAAVLAKRDEYKQLRHDQLMAHALDRIVAGAGSVSGMAPAEVSVLIDLATLTTGTRRNDSVCEFSDGSNIPGRDRTTSRV